MDIWLPSLGVAGERTQHLPFKGEGKVPRRKTKHNKGRKGKGGARGEGNNYEPRRQVGRGTEGAWLEDGGC